MRLGLVLGTFLAAAPVMALAPRPAAAQQQDDPRLTDLEEQVLRTQVETYLNDFAHWDADRKMVVFARPNGGGGQGQSQLGGLEPIAQMMLSRMVRPDAQGRLHLRDEVRLRPFADVVQEFIKDGGADDIEKFQRFRSGEGENPWKSGPPPRVMKAVAGFMKALDEQTRNLGKAEAKPQDGGRGDAEPRRLSARADAKRDAEKTAEARTARMKKVREAVGKRLGMDDEELAEIETYARELAAEAGKDAERLAGELKERFDAFSKTERGQQLRDRAARLGRRAEDEVKRALESEDVKTELAAAQKRAMEYLASPDGQALERRALEWLDTDNGRSVRRRAEELLGSDQGQDLLRRIAERFMGGGKPQPPAARERAKPEAAPERAKTGDFQDLKQRADELRRASERLRDGLGGGPDELRRRTEELRRTTEELRRSTERLRQGGKREEPRGERDAF